MTQRGAAGIVNCAAPVEHIVQFTRARFEDLARISDPLAAVEPVIAIQDDADGPRLRPAAHLPD